MRWKATFLFPFCVRRLLLLSQGLAIPIVNSCYIELSCKKFSFDSENLSCRLEFFTCDKKITWSRLADVYGMNAGYSFSIVAMF